MPRLLNIHPVGAGKGQTVQLYPTADQQQLEQQLREGVAIDAVVEVPIVLPTQIESSTLFVRPKACAMWVFAELSDEQMQAMPSGNWLVDLARMSQQAQQRGHRRP